MTRETSKPTMSLADDVVAGWIEALDELLEDGVISREAGDRLFYRSADLASEFTVARHMGLTVDQYRAGEFGEAEAARLEAAADAMHAERVEAWGEVA